VQFVRTEPKASREAVPLDGPRAPKLAVWRVPPRALGLGLDPPEHARNGSLGRVFDHVGIAVSDLASSGRFYRTVLSVLGVEPSHADAELVEWDDWA
jgi:hypothetical protein